MSSYTLVDDDGTLQVRASIRTKEQLSELIEKLETRKESLPTATVKEIAND